MTLDHLERIINDVKKQLHLAERAHLGVVLAQKLTRDILSELCKLRKIEKEKVS